MMRLSSLFRSRSQSSAGSPASFRAIKLDWQLRGLCFAHVIHNSSMYQNWYNVHYQKVFVGRTTLSIYIAAEPSANGQVLLIEGPPRLETRFFMTLLIPNTILGTEIGKVLISFDIPVLPSAIPNRIEHAKDRPHIHGRYLHPSTRPFNPANLVIGPS